MDSLLARLFFCTRGERLVNGLFCFCSNCHHCCAPIRLLHVSDVMITYCNKWRPQKAGQLKRYQKTKLGRTKERTGEGMLGLLWTSGVCFWACQLAVRISWASIKCRCLGVILRLTEVSSCVNLCFLVFGSSEKDYPCNKQFQALSDVT